MSFDQVELLGALDSQQFVPYFQPIIELRTGQLAAFEVLARWNRPVSGTVSPDEFIPSIERRGLIEKLTRSMLEQAFAAPAIAASSLGLSVNVSPIQMSDSRLPEYIAAAAARSAFALHRLTIEVTESALLEDLPRAQAVAADLKALGCKLALDDFGTGYSSLKHLHALPFDEIKVDRSFVSSMLDKRASRKIVASVIGLGQSLGLVTTAEGVETPSQAATLFRMGCDLVQGWLYGKPVPASALQAVVEEHRNTAASLVPSVIFGGTSYPEAPPEQRLAQLQAIYDGAPVGLCLLDRELRYVSINRRLADLNCNPAVLHLGKTPAEMVPDVYAISGPYMHRALEGETVMGIEVHKPPREGFPKGQDLLCSYVPVRDEEGEVIGVSVAVMDNSDHKAMEDALKESEEHFRQMLQLSPHVPWVINPAGEVVEASARWEEFTGQPLAHALGHGWKQMLHPDDLPAVDEAIRMSLQAARDIDVNYRIRAVDGSWTWMRARGAPRRGGDGQVLKVYGVVELLETDAHVTI